MADKREYYESLGVARDSTQKQIKDAYRRLARKLHPDVNPDPEASEKFKEIGEAYSILSDPEKRTKYDQFGHDAFQGGGPGAGGFPGGMTINMEDLFSGAGGASGDLGDLFEEMLGAAMGGGFRGSQARGRRKGADLQFVMELSLEEVAKGVKKPLRYRRHVTCEHCHGSGGAPDVQPVECTVCHGRGWVGQSSGFMTIRRTCPKCHGAGQINPMTCKECGGRGYIEKEETLNIDIPAGVDTNSHIRYESMGETGANGGHPGDLYVIAKIREHDFFVRKGDNLYCEIPINLYEATLGAKIRVPTLTGSSTINIPAGSATGDEVLLKGKGIPHLRGWGLGNQVCRLKVVVPSNITREQKKLFQQLRELDKSDVRKHLKSKTG